MSLVGPDVNQHLSDWVTEKATPSAAGGGMESTEQSMALEDTNYGANLIKNGSVEDFSSGASSAPDNWTLSGAGAAVASDSGGDDVQEGSKSVRVDAALNTETALTQTITISDTQNTRLRGRRVTFIVRTRPGSPSPADRVFVRITDGVTTKDSPLHPGGAVFQTLSASIVVAASATSIAVSGRISSGAVAHAYFDAMKLVEGDAITAFTPHASDLDDASVITAKLADGAVTEVKQTLADNTTQNVTSTKHGYVPKAPGDATKFLDGSATPVFDTVKDSDLSTSDISTNDVSTSKHGFVPKAPNDTTKFLRGDAAWAVGPGAWIFVETINTTLTSGDTSEDFGTLPTDSDEFMIVLDGVTKLGTGSGETLSLRFNATGNNVIWTAANADNSPCWGRVLFSRVAINTKLPVLIQLVADSGVATSLIAANATATSVGFVCSGGGGFSWTLKAHLFKLAKQV